MEKDISKKIEALEIGVESLVNQVVGLKTLNESLKQKLKDKEQPVHMDQPHAHRSEVREKLNILIKRVDKLIQKVQRYDD